ncbi:hypothetical protein MNEG_6597 [Monoraphidium neglectum]|jgi:histone H1/5|uniref:Uncharacterized protein n=1 Tax=Monoraphidium neglectum TaxID=145388 RepID=A0A0D2MDT1_9CHLO|nr:hypothetical protein MNEG_6597 [Monoraphidium neglectum]KIZ01365.1 hypothetical protein MNEG_6597 [Monoraphidium neglectum]|eukprot:XP_013900384.1 hypothetical protein MNEG_6597 [Monoraphidium neglectum]
MVKKAAPGADKKALKKQVAHKTTPKAPAKLKARAPPTKAPAAPRPKARAPGPAKKAAAPRRPAGGLGGLSYKRLADQPRLKGAKADAWAAFEAEQAALAEAYPGPRRPKPAGCWMGAGEYKDIIKRGGRLVAMWIDEFGDWSVGERVF